MPKLHPFGHYLRQSAFSAHSTVGAQFNPTSSRRAFVFHIFGA
jgi:hypothetical protein